MQLVRLVLSTKCALLLAAFPGKDFKFSAGTRLHFIDLNTLRSLSSDQVVIPIINDDIAEPCKSFICTLQGGGVDSIRSIEPYQVTIEICDDDGEHMHVFQFIMHYMEWP